jgi:hypothetical protein
LTSGAGAAVRRFTKLRGLQQAGAVALGYAVLVCGLTWPLAIHLASHLPATFFGSEFDPLYSAWTLAWESHTLAHGSLAIGNANIYYPARDTLFYGPAALGALLYFAPVYLLTGNPTLAVNLLLLGSIALTATALHLVAYSWTRLHAAGLVAGMTFLANRWLLCTFVPTVPHLAVLFYFPVIILLSTRLALRSWQAVLLCGLVVLQGLTDVAYVAPAVLAPLVTLAALRLVRPVSRANGLRLLTVALAAALILLAIHFPYRAVVAANPRLAEQTNWRIDPMQGSLELPGGLMGILSPLAVPTLALALIAATGMVSLLRGWRGSGSEASAARNVLLWIAVGLFISLPMRVSVFGYVYTLPHLALAHRWVGFALRLPERLRVAALMGTALLAGLAFAELLRQLGLAAHQGWRTRRSRGALTTLLCVAMYGQYATAAGQPQAYGPPLPVLYRLREPPGDSPVLHVLRAVGGPTLEAPLPPFKPTAAAAHAPAMYRSIYHWQPLLNGYSSYWPAGFAELMRLAAQLPDPAALRALRSRTGLAFILVRARDQLPIDSQVAAQRGVWLDLARRGGRPDLQLVASDDDLLLFRVTGEEPVVHDAGGRPAPALPGGPSPSPEEHEDHARRE